MNFRKYNIIIIIRLLIRIFINHYHHHHHHKINKYLIDLNFRFFSIFIK